MSLWDALTDIQKKVTEGVEQFQEVFDPNAVASPPPRPRHVSSSAFSVDNDDSASKKPCEDAVSRRPDASQSSRDLAGSSAARPQANSGGPSRTLASASRDELVALVQRQAAKIQQLQSRSDESHQENQVLRQERDTLKNMLRASDAELTEAKKFRAAVRSDADNDASIADSLKSQISHLQSLLSEKSHSVVVVQPTDSSITAESHDAKDDYSQQKQKLESLLQESQKLQQDNEIVLHAAQQRISFLESENASNLARAAESRSFVLAEAEATSNALRAQLVESQAEVASLGGIVLELRTKVCALEASLDVHASNTATNVRILSCSVAVQTVDISLTCESSLLTEVQNQIHVSVAAMVPSEHEYLDASASGQPSHGDLFKAQALSESATAEAVTYRAQLSLAESRISELVAKLDELQSHVARQAAEGQPVALDQQVHNFKSESASSDATDVAEIRSEMEDLISALDHLSAAVASVNFPNQPALPTHSLPCHLSKAAFSSFKQLADAVDTVVSQLVSYPLYSLKVASHSARAGRR
jgi:DNA repair exonuclease SbcCD ATPase subunit